MLKDNGFWDVPYLRIRLIKPFKGSFRHTADDQNREDESNTEDHPSREKLTIYPSNRLSTGNGERSALYGGCVRSTPADPKGGYGITTAHLFDKGKDQVVKLLVHETQGYGREKPTIGVCSHVVDEIKSIQRNEEDEV